MSKIKKMADPARRAELLAGLHRDVSEREQGYRMQALKIFPHVCARCLREFEGSRLRELTVHHKDHDHNNNPPDGSNWELLCLYCHDHEHEKFKMAGHRAAAKAEEKKLPPSIFSQFEGLDALLKGKTDASKRD
jgi:hypothetical protein